MEVPWNEIREKYPQSSPSVAAAAVTTSVVVVSAEEAGCTQAAESEVVVAAFEASAEAHVAVAGIVVPSRREVPSH